MAERKLTELDVRHMLDHARRYQRSRRAGRWIVLTGHRGVGWGIVVRPVVDLRVVEVITVLERKRQQ